MDDRIKDIESEVVRLSTASEGQVDTEQIQELTTKKNMLVKVKTEYKNLKEVKSKLDKQIRESSKHALKFKFHDIYGWY